MIDSKDIEFDKFMADFQSKYQNEIEEARKRVRKWIEDGDFTVTDITHLFIPVDVRLREDVQ